MTEWRRACGCAVVVAGLVAGRDVRVEYQAIGTRYQHGDPLGALVETSAVGWVREIGIAWFADYVAGVVTVVVIIVIVIIAAVVVSAV